MFQTDECHIRSILLNVNDNPCEIDEVNPLSEFMSFCVTQYHGDSLNIKKSGNLLPEFIFYATLDSLILKYSHNDEF